MISGRAVPALERLFFSVSRGKSAGQADQHSTLPQPWGYTFNSSGRIVVTGDTSANAEMLTEIRGSSALGY
jgi:hypothetical protein